MNRLKVSSQGKSAVCCEALLSMENGKSPGNDGLTRKSYICFFNEISHLLTDALNHSYQVGQLSTTTASGFDYIN